MNFRRMMFGILATTVVMALNSVVLSKTEANSGDQQTYEQCLNQIISSCYAKAHLADSRSENLRDYCELAGLKAKFIILNKERLIEEMRQIDLAPKAYKINLYVNSRFYEKLRREEP